MEANLAQNFYISDTHFGHGNIIRFDSRPFDSLEEMGAALIENWSNAVSNEDTVYILGDFHWGTESGWISCLSKLNGHKVLIKGNHDLKQMSARLRKMFDDVKDYKEINDGGRKVIMSHYPIICYKQSYAIKTWMLHGHVHNNTKEAHFLKDCVRNLITSRTDSSDNRGQIINVGCMMDYMGYTPRTLDELIASFDGGKIYA